MKKAFLIYSVLAVVGFAIGSIPLLFVAVCGQAGTGFAAMLETTCRK